MLHLFSALFVAAVLEPRFAVTADVQLVVPSSPSSQNVVASNFFGISFELSFMNEYCKLFLLLDLGTRSIGMV